MAPKLRVTELPAGTVADQPVRRFRLESSMLRLELMEYGATVLSVEHRCADQPWVCVSRGLAAPEHYHHNPAYMGSICGRYAGRIAGASYSGPGGEVQLSSNQGRHQLHGGTRGFNARFWRAEPFEQQDRVGVDFYYVSEDGEEGYPGALETKVRYSIDANARLWIEYAAEALDQTTPVNLTNHCYWNLADQTSGSASETVFGHKVQLAAQSVLELDANLLPTGASLPVKDTALDFSNGRRIGDAIAALPAGVDGLDHCLHNFSNDLSPWSEWDAELVAGPSELPIVARVHEPISGRQLSVYTDQPLLVFYTGNALNGSLEHGGVAQYGGFCIECQQFPDAPNQPGFPSPFVGQGERYEQTSVYAFSTSRVE